MSWVTNSVAEAITQLGEAVERRCAGHAFPETTQLVRTPVALMFVRGDRAEPGATLARQVVSSFGYWNHESQEYLDLVFFGWFKDGVDVGFQGHDGARIFRDCCEEIQAMSRWRYSGETDILLVDFDVAVTRDRHVDPTSGAFSFKHCIYLPVEKMIAEHRVRSLDALVTELVRAAETVYRASPHKGSIFEVSDRVAWTRGRKSIWDTLRKVILGDWSRVYDELRPFAVCDLRVRSSEAV